MESPGIRKAAIVKALIALAKEQEIAKRDQDILIPAELFLIRNIYRTYANNQVNGYHDRRVGAESKKFLDSTILARSTLSQTILNRTPNFDSRPVVAEIRGQFEVDVIEVL